MTNEEIRKWARKVLDSCDRITNTEKKIEYAEKYGFLRGSIEILLEYPEDVEFVAKRENDMDEKKNKEKLDK
jgi:hypothetical protein